jgi:hypothetical protein
VKLETNFADHNCNFDIFEQIANTRELVKELVKRELLIFKRYQLDVKDIKCPLQWWQKHEAMFPIVGFLAQYFEDCWITNRNRKDLFFD